MKTQEENKQEEQILNTKEKDRVNCRYCGFEMFKDEMIFDDDNVYFCSKNHFKAYHKTQEENKQEEQTFKVNQDLKELIFYCLHLYEQKLLKDSGFKKNQEEELKKIKELREILGFYNNSILEDNSFLKEQLNNTLNLLK